MTRTAVVIATATTAPGPSSNLLLQRKCACAGQVSSNCEECGNEKLQRKAYGDLDAKYAPPLVNRVLRGPGQPLQDRARSFMEARFAHSFGNVRVHTDAEAARSARAVGAAAYTVGRNVVFNHGRYAPEAANGRRLLAHELTHVVQQRGATAQGGAGGLQIDSSHSAGEVEAERISAAIDRDPSPATTAQPIHSRLHQSAEIVSRRDAGAPDAVPLVMNLGKTPRTGLQFWPTDVKDTVVGPVTVQGGLLDGGTSRLNVIIGENMTLHILALELLPLWTTATPFTPPGAATPLPLDPITADQLARALLIYNQTYLQVPLTMPPLMTKWRSGLRLPLPVEIDKINVATLHPQQIIGLAGAFNPAWTPLLEQRAAANATPSAATIQAEVATFLREHSSALDRGITLGARALTNATAELPFVRGVFQQLGVAGSADVALAFLDNFVNREIDLLAAQRDGLAILKEFETAIEPTVVSMSESQEIKEANLVSTIISAHAVAPPAATRSRREKTVSIDTLKLEGSNRNPAADVTTANSILAQCNVRVVHGVNATATAAESAAWIGPDLTVEQGDCKTPSTDVGRLAHQATAKYGMGARIRAFYVRAISTTARASTCPPSRAGALLNGFTWVSNTAMGRSLAHEIGHNLLDPGPHTGGTTNIMAPTNKAPTGETIDDPRCNRIYNNA
jgi:hypothetical protein